VPAIAWMTNVAAAAAGLLVFAMVRKYAPRSPRPLTQFALGGSAIAAILLPFASPGLLGVHRWVALGGLRLHASAIVAPLIIACVATIARRNAAIATAVAALVTTILALQPDAAQAFSFAAASITLVTFNRARPLYQTAGAMLLAGAAVTSLTQHDPLQPVAHVEGILALVASSGAVWAVLGTAALFLLPVPFLTTFARRGNRLALALGLYVGMTILSALFGPFPVPVMGYGASPILGYFLALALCDARSSRSPARHGTDHAPEGPAGGGSS
jgi:hypothetical protein